MKVEHSLKTEKEASFSYGHKIPRWWVIMVVDALSYQTELH